MPILKEEPSLYPETLLDEAPRDVADRRWFALYTKARQEKSLARELLKQRIPFYLPLVKKTNVSRGRKRISQMPLFGGYCFSMGRRRNGCDAWPPTGFPAFLRSSSRSSLFSICGSFAD